MGEKRKATEEAPGQPMAKGLDSVTSQEATLQKPLEGPPEDSVSRDRHFAELYTKTPDFKQLALQDKGFALLYVLAVRFLQ